MCKTNNNTMPTSCSVCNSTIICHECHQCGNLYCEKCFKDNCDTGGGQDLDVYFFCPSYRSKPTDKQLIEYMLSKLKKTREDVINDIMKGNEKCEELTVKIYNHTAGVYF